MVHVLDLDLDRLAYRSTRGPAAALAGAASTRNVAEMAEGRSEGRSPSASQRMVCLRRPSVVAPSTMPKPGISGRVNLMQSRERTMQLRQQSVNAHQQALNAVSGSSQATGLGDHDQDASGSSSNEGAGVRLSDTAQDFDGEKRAKVMCAGRAAPAAASSPPLSTHAAQQNTRATAGQQNTSAPPTSGRGVPAYILRRAESYKFKQER